MKVKLLKPANIRHEAGDTVEVSPVRADLLIAGGYAVAVKDKKEGKKKK